MKNNAEVPWEKCTLLQKRGMLLRPWLTRPFPLEPPFPYYRLEKEQFN